MSIPHQDNIIKNPHRDQDHTPTPYTPEYKRLKVEPIIQDFPSLDGEFIEPSNFDSSVVESHIIDNNENISYNFGTQILQPQTNNSPNIGEFLLMVSGEVITHGSQEYILAEAKSVLYQEHPKFLGKKIKMDELIILKRIGLKIGVFLDQ